MPRDIGETDHRQIRRIVRDLRKVLRTQRMDHGVCALAEVFSDALAACPRQEWPEKLKSFTTAVELHAEATLNDGRLVVN